MSRIAVHCPHCGRQGRLPESVKELPKKVKCPGCRNQFSTASPQPDEFTIVPDGTEQFGERAKKTVAEIGEKVKAAAKTAKDYATSDDVKMALDGALKRANELGGRAKDAISTPQSNGAGSSGSSGLVRGVLDLLDLKFQRYYTILLVNLLWAGYLLFAALILAFCLLLIIIPGTMLGLTSDMVTTVYDPSPPSRYSEAKPSGHFGPFIFALLFLGFIGMNLRVFLEMLSVQFRIAETLNELRQSQADRSGDHSLGQDKADGARS